MDEHNNQNMVLAIVLTIAIILAWQIYVIYTSHDSKQKNANIEQNISDQNNFPPAISMIQSLKILKNDSYLPIESNNIKGGINLRGAVFDSIILKNYYYKPEKKGGNVVLLAPMNSQHPYYVRFSWVSHDTNMPTRNTLWSIEGNNKILTPSTPVTLSWESPQKILFQQIYSIDQKSMITVVQKVTNLSNRSISIAPYGMVARVGTNKLVNSYLLHEGMIGYLSNSLREVKYSKIQEEHEENYKTIGGWLGITDKYWLVALILDKKEHVYANFRSGIVDGREIYQATEIYSPFIVHAGYSCSKKIHFFIGPKSIQTLTDYQNQYDIPKFKLVVDFGILYLLTEPLFYLIHWFNHVLNNFGLAILALTILVKLILFPLSYKSYVSMLRMKLLYPKIKLLKKTCEGDRQKLSAETMALYKKEGINPMSGCLPIIIQLPIFFALYKVLFITIEMRQAPFFGWIKDLSAPDPLGILTGFGLFHWNIPDFLSAFNISIWPILMGISMWLQQKSTPNNIDPQQAQIMQWLPIIFPFFMIHFPAGLVIYWTFSNILTAFQQWIMNIVLSKKIFNTK